MAIGSTGSSGTCQCTASRSLLAHELGGWDLGKLVVAAGGLVSQRREPANDRADGSRSVAAVDPGARPRTRMPTQASGVSTIIGRPAITALTMRRAARSASIDSSGRDAAGANHAYSAGASPLKRT